MPGDALRKDARARQKAETRGAERGGEAGER